MIRGMTGNPLVTTQRIHRVCLAFTILLGAGCTTYQPAGAPGVWRDAKGQVVPPSSAKRTVVPEPLQVKVKHTGPYLIHVGDSFDISVEHAEPLALEDVRVGPDGKIALPLVGTVTVEGKTLDHVRKTLSKLYSSFLVDSHVSVRLRRYLKRTCTILGQVRNPGLYPVEGKVTLLQAIAAAGGFLPARTRAGQAPGADLSQAFVSRAGTILRLDFAALFRRGNLSQNILLQPGDLVYIPSVSDRAVIVLGQVRAAGRFPLSRGLTVLSAIGMAGGFSDLAGLKNLAVVRHITSEPMVRIVDLEAILSGRALDFPLLDGDVVFVPRDDLRAFDIPAVLKNTSALAAAFLITD